MNAIGVRVVRIGPADELRLRAFKNRVAAMLLSLAIENALEAAEAAVRAMLVAPGPVDDIRRFLPLALRLARLTDEEEPLFRRRMREEPTMGNLLDEIKAEGEARGEARGKIAEIRRLVSKGRLTVDAARAEIEELIATQAIPEAIGREALGQLG